MLLPTLAPGRRFALNRPVGSADALLLARLAQREVAARHPLAIVTAEPADTQRLEAEIAFFAPELRVAVFPDWETLPYDTFSPHQDLISERLATLWRILQRDVDVVLVPATTALGRLAPPSFLAATTFNFKQKSKLDEAGVESAAHARRLHAREPGGVARRVRGARRADRPVPDGLGRAVSRGPVRRRGRFDPHLRPGLAAQPVPGARRAPAAGARIPARRCGAHRRSARAGAKGSKATRRSRASTRTSAPGSRRPASSTTCRCSSTRPPRCSTISAQRRRIALHGDVDEALKRFWADTRERHRFLQHDPERPMLPPEDLFLRPEEFFTLCNEHAQLSLRGQEPVEWASPRCPTWRSTATPRSRCRRCRLTSTAARAAPCCWPRAKAGAKACSTCCANTTSRCLRASSLAEFEAERANASPSRSRRSPRLRLARLPASTSSPRPSCSRRRRRLRRRRKQERESDVDALIKDLSELKIGDPVVHASHGIGRYQGLLNIDLGDGPSEFLHLTYADNATLYVPVAQLHLISRYTGVSAEEAPLHKLGSNQWDKARRKAAEQVRDTAAELLDLYARRAAREGFAFRFSPQDYEAFAATFGFEETPDQRAAIHAVIQDMISPKPMDRLVCGDVGFGKTEVALRAAFVAVLGGKQVALLAPTTLLAEQHYQNIVDRFSQVAGQGGRAVALPHRRRRSRRRSKAWRPARSTSSSARTSCCRRDVKFKQLGLLVIDEEHRFGVRHKEQIKSMRAEVDVLTLTATPIPRTLGMALEGLRDLSVIATAPQRRLAIKTFVRNEGAERDPRGGAARVEARRAGVLPAQRGRDDRAPPHQARRSWCPRRASRSRTARCASASSSA